MGCWGNTRTFRKSPPKSENKRVLYMRSPTYATNVSHNNGDSIRDRYCFPECHATLFQLERCTTSQIVAEKESESHLTIKKLTSSKTRYLEVIGQLLSPCIARVHRDKHCASWVEHKFGSLKDKFRLSVCNSFLNRVNLLRYYRQHLSKNTSH